MPLFCYAVFCVLFYLAEEGWGWLMLSSSSHIGVVIINFFLTVSCVGQQCVIMAFVDHYHFL